MTPKQKELMKLIKLNGSISTHQVGLVFASAKHGIEVIKHLTLMKLVNMNYGYISLTEKGEDCLNG